MKRTTLLLVLLLTAIPLFAGTANMYFVGFSTLNPTWEAGYPYRATADLGPVINVMCDDWFHGGFPSQQWVANVTNLGTGNLSLLRFNQLTDALTLYHEAGWLLLQAEATPPLDWQDRQNINFAVWKTFDPNTDFNLDPQGPLGPLSWMAKANAEAAAGFPGVDFSQIVIYTPVYQYDPNAPGPQELLTTVPEPATLILLAGGALAAWGRKKLG